MSRSAAASDARHMRAALALAGRALGRVWPNPAVGCVVTSQNGAHVLGRGVTGRGGRPHAETEALARARALFGGGALAGATAYVTLEPCSHTGETPPCAEALIAAGCARVIAATGDPDPRVAGRGLARLRAAGVTVEEGLLGPEARALNAGYLLHRTAGRPLVTLKTATTLDARIASPSGESRWITDAQARRHGHLLRARHDAVLIGIGTALADDPRLDCRLAGLERESPVRVVLDSKLRLALDSRLVASAEARALWVLHGPQADAAKAARLAAQGVVPHACPRGGEGLALDQVLAWLAGQGITRLLVEGGARVATGFLRAGLVDRIAWYRAPGLIGGDGRAAIGPLGVAGLADAPRFACVERRLLGDDVLEVYERPGLSG